jgi:nucleotide-binding universal stress UspA family protein
MIPATIPEIKKILYATDLSENARYAFGYAMSLANQYGAGITILHVLESSASSESLVTNVIGEKRWNELRKENEQEVVKTIKERLENFCEEVTREVPECPFITDEIIVKIGVPADEIMDLIESRDYDMVVMGAHGHGILGSAMMGSISRRVVRHSRKPVLVVRLPEKS